MKTKLFSFLTVVAILFCNHLANAQSGVINTIAGNGTPGYVDNCAATTGEINLPGAALPVGVAIDTFGNVYITDNGNNVIRKISPAGFISTIAGNGTAGYSGDGGSATAAELSNPNTVIIDKNGNLYFSEYGNKIIRKINTLGIISTIAGNGTGGYSGDGGLATAAQLSAVCGVAIDASGNVYIPDTYNNVIRKVNTAGIINTIAGNGAIGYSGDGGIATVAEMFYPTAIAVDNSGNIYIADQANMVIRKINSDGIISTFAGNGFGAGSWSGSYSGDGGPATAAELFGPTSVVLDNSGNIYIGDAWNNAIRKVNTSGIITTIAGNGYEAGTGSGGYSGDGGAATAAELNIPIGVAVSTIGNVYIADSHNNRIREVNGGTPTQVPKLSINNNYSLYPNPATTQLTITTTTSAYALFTITNMLGQQELQQPITAPEIQVNIDALPAGVYFVTFTNENGQVIKKFIKM